MGDPNAYYQAGDDKKFPIKWTSPESIEYLRFGLKSDVWSFGVTLFEIFTKGKIPYAGIPNSEILPRLRRGYRMPREDTIPVDIYKMMRECWDEKPEKRPTFADMEGILEKVGSYADELS